MGDALCQAEQGKRHSYGQHTCSPARLHEGTVQHGCGAPCAQAVCAYLMCVLPGSWSKVKSLTFFAAYRMVSHGMTKRVWCTWPKKIIFPSLRIRSMKITRKLNQKKSCFKVSFFRMWYQGDLQGCSAGQIKEASQKSSSRLVLKVTIPMIQFLLVITVKKNVAL